MLACENARQHRAGSALLTTCVASIEAKAGENRELDDRLRRLFPPMGDAVSIGDLS